MGSNRIHGLVQILLTIVVILFVSKTSSMELFSVKLVDLADSRLIATSGSNYALISPELLSKGWRTVSVNENDVYIVSITGQSKHISKNDFGPQAMETIETIRDRLAATNFGYTQISNIQGSSNSFGPGGNGVMVSNSNGNGNSMSSSSFSSSSMMSSSSGGMSLNMRDENNFSVSKPNLPFNWSSLYYNGDIITMIFKNGTVQMQPINVLDIETIKIIEGIKNEASSMQKVENQQFQNTMKHTFDMVSNMFNDIASNMPKPPTFASMGGGMFGNNFPFGPNNNPFKGWPFTS